MSIADALGRGRGNHRPAGKAAIKKQTRKRKWSVTGIQAAASAKAVPVAMPVASTAVLPHGTQASNVSSISGLSPPQALANNAAAAGTSGDQNISLQLPAAQPCPLSQPALPSFQEQHPCSDLVPPPAAGGSSFTNCVVGVAAGPSAKLEQADEVREVSVSGNSSKRDTEDCPTPIVKADADSNMLAVKPDADVDTASAGDADAQYCQGVNADKVPPPDDSTLACNQLIDAPAPALPVMSKPDAIASAKAGVPAVSAQGTPHDAHMQTADPAMVETMTATAPAETDQPGKLDHSLQRWQDAAAVVHAAAEQPQMPQPDADMAPTAREVSNEKKQSKSDAPTVGLSEPLHGVLNALLCNTEQDSSRSVLDKVQQAQEDGLAVTAATPLDLLQHSDQGEGFPRAATGSVKSPQASPGAFVESQPEPAGAPSSSQADTAAQQQHEQECVDHQEPQDQQGNVIVADRSAFTGLVDYADSDCDSE